MSEDAWTTVAGLLATQSGVVSRRQVVALGLHDHDIRRRLRRREWAVVLPGVYVEHTGLPTWRQRAWAAVLSLEPAALSHRSAIRAALDHDLDARSPDQPPHLAVDRDRALRAPDGVVLHRVARFEEQVLANTSPPRQRFEEAVLDVAAAAVGELAVVSTLAEAVGSRRTTAGRLETALSARPRIAQRRLIAALLADVRSGTCSVLEHGYLVHVERAHHLPSADRQVRASVKGTIYRDVEYPAWKTAVELDGRVHHTSVADRDRDLDRDLMTAAQDRVTLRIGWGQVFGRPCATAGAVGAVLNARGWGGTAQPCPRCGGSLAPGASDRPRSA